MGNRMKLAVRTCIFTVIFVIIFTAVVRGLVDDGTILQMWFSIIAQIPFGKFFGEFAMSAFSEGFGMGIDINTYAINAQPLTFLKILEDVCKLILTAAFYQAVDFAIQSCLKVAGKGIGKGRRKHITMMQVCSKIIAVMVSTFLATAAITAVYSQLHQFSNFVQGLVSGIVALISIVGGYFIASTVLVATVSGVLFFVLFKMILLNVLKVSATYVGLLLFTLFINEGAWGAVGMVSVTWALLIIMLTGIELMLDGLFTYKRS